MANWTQYTYRNTVLSSKIERTADRMIELMAQLHFLKQAGEDIVVTQETNDRYETTSYMVTRSYKDGTVITYVFEKGATA